MALPPCLSTQPAVPHCRLTFLLFFLLSRLQDGRSGCGVASLNGLLYAVGGINGAGDTVRSAEAFNPSTQQWTPLPSMHEPRRSFGVAALNGLLYACGGNDGMHDLATLEVYDPKTRRWKLLAPMRYVHPSLLGSVKLKPLDEDCACQLESTTPNFHLTYLSTTFSPSQVPDLTSLPLLHVM